MSIMNGPDVGELSKHNIPSRKENEARGSLQVDSDDQEDINISDDLKTFLAKNSRLIDQEREKLHAIFARDPSDDADDRDDDDDDDDDGSTQEEIFSDFSGSCGDKVNSLRDLLYELSLADDDKQMRKTPRRMIPRHVPNGSGRKIITTMLKQNHTPDSSRSLNITMDYTLFDHCTYLKVSESSHLGFVCDTSDYFDLSAHRIPGSMFELCQPVPDETLSMVFFGLTSHYTRTTPSSVRLPVRTVTIRIRPDVMCGEVINAVYVAVMASSNRSGGVHLLRKQRGHMRAVIVWGEDNLKYIYDAQICIRKLGSYSRELMIRIYHPSAEELVEVECLDADSIRGEIASSRDQGYLNLKNPLNLQLREACALVNLIRAIEKNEKGKKSERHWQDSSFPNSKRVNSPRSASLHLRAVGNQSKSLEDQKKKGQFQQFPALCVKDWTVIQASTIAVENTWACLSDRIVYGSLNGAFLGNVMEPSKLLDQHYCMQLYLMTRDRTLHGIDCLLQAVEKKICHIDAINSTFWSLIKTMVERYDMSEIITAIETEMPPPDDSNYLEIALSLARELIVRSGILSKEKLESSSLVDVVESAVQVAQYGYEKQLEATHNERIENLYHHATTRLAKKESWLRKIYDKFLDYDLWNGKALEEAAAFLALIEGNSAYNSDANSYSVRGTDLPPHQCRIESLVLLQFDVDRGTCRISATHVVVVVRQLFQKSKVTVFSLDEIEVQTRKSSGGCFQIIRGGEIHNLRPMGLDAHDAAGFIEILQRLLNQ